MSQMREKLENTNEVVFPPVDMRLQGTSSWINLVTKRDQQTPAGWSTTDGAH